MLKLLKRVITAALLLTIVGCGTSRTPVVSQAPPPPTPIAAHEIAETSIKLADPKGRWLFQVEADRVEAATVHGPFDMSPARARYDEKEKPPIIMSAKQAHVDEAANRVIFEGNVDIASPTWRLQADRVVYNLDTGEVEATGRTKWALTPQPASKDKDGK